MDWSQVVPQLLSPGVGISFDVNFKIIPKYVFNDKDPENENIDQAEASLIIVTADHDKNASPKDFSQPCIQPTQTSSQKVESSMLSSMHEDFPPAHKLILASVSPVFRFYGSIPVGEVVDIKDSSVKAFKIMINYIYQNKEDRVVQYGGGWLYCYPI